MALTFDDWVAAQARERGLPASVVEYQSGMPVWVIAARHGVTPKTVRKRARLLGVKGRKTKIVGAWAARIVARYEGGMAWREIERVEGIDSTTLSDLLRREGVRLRTKNLREKI